MTILIEEDPVDYTLRAAARPMPLGWIEPLAPLTHDAAFAADLAAVGQTFWADGSIYQPVINGSYPYRKFGFRADSGTDTDGHAAGNWAYCEDPARIDVAIAYLVFKPGQRAAIMRRVRNLFGTECPDNLVLEIDMESGDGFAGPGNHSTEANGLAADLAAYAGSQLRVQGYANTPDWAACWPTPPAWMKRRLAYYSASAWPVPAGYYAVQYYGALPYGSPPGFPRACDPFGAYVDMNVTPRTIDQIKTDYGIGDPAVALDDSDKAWLTNLLQMHYQAVTGKENSVFSGGTNVADAVAAIKTQLTYLADYIGGTDNSVYKGGTSALDVLKTVTNLDAQTQDQLNSILNAIEALDAQTPGNGPVNASVTGTLTLTPQETS